MTASQRSLTGRADDEMRKAISEALRRTAVNKSPERKIALMIAEVQALG
jgi:hypothetical protein